jgi:hypothetical protein
MEIASAEQRARSGSIQTSDLVSDQNNLSTGCTPQGNMLVLVKPCTYASMKSSEISFWAVPQKGNVDFGGTLFLYIEFL